ncbi:MAG: chorismate synthase, partial [Alphaproteobacteria bacterium]|nr:chorismate synthase [Alphaproteobacteria bacterium]
MTGNRFGTLFQYTTFGESHGPAIGCVVDGVPPRIALTPEDIQGFLDRRKPGQSRHTTQRKEPDTVEILSGVFEGLTTGTPIGLLIRNQDQKSKDYGDIKDKFRPGHADFTYQEKYGIRDYRGGGRSSARETACRVAAGAVARKVLEDQIGGKVKIRAAVVQVGEKKINRDRWNWDQVGQNPLWLPDAGAVPEIEEYLDGIRKSGSSAGALVEVHASGIPAGLGAPVYDKLDADL